MTKKVYRTAMGKTVDIGALLLQNENTRAVGNMGVNARGDVINNKNQVIENRARQIQRRTQKNTKVASAMPSSTSNQSIKQNTISEQFQPEVDPADTFDDLPEDNDVVVEQAEAAQPAEELRGGLAAAIAKAKAVNQERMKTPREMARAQGVKKI